MGRQAFQISTALLFSTVVLLATALGSSAQNFPGPALPAPARADTTSFFTSPHSRQIATSSAVPNATAVTLGGVGAPPYSPNGGIAWVTVGQGPWSSWQTAWIAIAPRPDPAAPVRLVVSAAYLVIARTGDYGRTWVTTMLPSPPNVAPGDCCRESGPIVVSPVDPDRLYAKFGLIPDINPPPDRRLSQDSHFVKYAVYTSGDGGVNWQLILYGAGDPPVTPSPILAGRLYVGSKRSDDAGATWVDLPWSFEDPLALDANNSNSLYRLSLDYNVIGGTGQGLRSTDGGTTWTPWAQQPCGGYYQLIAHPTLSNVLFLRCDSGLWRSHNGGDSWQALSVARGQVLAPDYGHPGRLLWGRSDGLWASTDQGTQWTNLTPDYLAVPSLDWRSRTKPSSFASECDTCELNAVAALSLDNAWAVGDQGMIVHWDGNAWAKVSSPVTTTLNAISMVSANDGWAVGAGGTILRWNGNAWSQVTSPVVGTGNLNSVDMVSTADGWAVGDNWPITQSMLAHWNGSAWTEVPSPVDGALQSVLMLSTNDGWAVGSAILRWNGTAWTSMDSSKCPALYAVAGIATNAIWAVGRFGQICRWDGSDWSLFLVSYEYPTAILNAIAMVSLNDGWLVGDRGLTAHWNGYDWNRTPWRLPTAA